MFDLNLLKFIFELLLPFQNLHYIKLFLYFLISYLKHLFQFRVRLTIEKYSEFIKSWKLNVLTAIFSFIALKQFILLSLYSIKVLYSVKLKHKFGISALKQTYEHSKCWDYTANFSNEIHEAIHLSRVVVLKIHCFEFQYEKFIIKSVVPLDAGTTFELEERIWLCC